MSKSRKRRKRHAGNGIGSHHEVSPMARGTRTLSREGKRRKADRQRKQKGWA